MISKTTMGLGNKRYLNAVCCKSEDIQRYRAIYRFSILITINKEISISSINRCPRGKTVRVASGRGGNAFRSGDTNVAT